MIASRTFSTTDQSVFARWSGDFNPLHMDPLAARRTQAGAPVVHGIHALIWALDQLSGAGVPVAAANKIDVQFSKFIYRDRLVVLRLVARTDAVVRAELTVGDLRVMSVLLRLGPRKGRGEHTVPPGAPTQEARDGIPGSPPAGDMENMAGWLDVTAPREAVAGTFPEACRALGTARVAGLIQLSYLVGMICPGLHSIFVATMVEIVDEDVDAQRLGFRVAALREDVGAVRMEVVGCGLSGNVLAMLRTPPVASPDFEAIIPRVPRDRFAGSNVLVVGGSRGLGAVAAKAIAVGGGRVTITYAKGRDDAEAVATEIERYLGAGRCMVINFDASRAVEKQLDCIGESISHLYYFATPHIFQQAHEVFSAVKFSEFSQVYVNGFYETCRAILAQSNEDGLSALYPSSVAVVSHPAGFTEYAMAKSAGEVLCDSMSRSLPRLRILVSRLPRTLTDQTNTVPRLENADPLDVLLPLIFQIQGERGQA